jgi:hypothetical protein
MPGALFAARFSYLGATRRAIAALLALGAAALSVAAPLTSATDPATALANSAALRLTVFGTAPQDLAPMPARVPIEEIDIDLRDSRPVPKLFWFDQKLRVWFSAQAHPAPLAIVIAGMGGDGNTNKLSILRGALFGAGYQVLTMPSPTFPNFIVAASSTGVAGDLRQDSEDLYSAVERILAHLPKHGAITDIDILGYSLGGANAAMIKAIDARAGKLHIHRAVMINPPVSLFTSIARLDKLFTLSIGSGDAGVEQLYRRLYAQLANLYRASGHVQIDEHFLLQAAAAILKSDAEFSAAIALSFRLDLVDMFFAGDWFAGTGVVIDPQHPPRVGDSLEDTARLLRGKPFSEYYARVFAPYYLRHRAHATSATLIADNRLDIIGDILRSDGDYYALTNADDFILDKSELAWLVDTMGARIKVYEHGGHLGNLGERTQIADLLQMLAGHWQGAAP